MAQLLHNKSDNPALEARLTEILDLLYSFYDQEIDMSLERVRRFLAQLGDPHLHLPPVIHVAGTNGKGSTIATLRSLLEASGKTVHVMTSPHLVHPTERIRLAGNLISTQQLISVLEECLAVNHDEPITFFEMFTAASFLAMSRIPADYVLLETGMGGRLDATNVVPNPICTIITTISKDHEAFLGTTLQKIAFEKAGIMKSGTPCIIGYQTRDSIKEGIFNIFHKVSTSLNTEAKLYYYGSQWQVEAVQNELHFTWEDKPLKTLCPSLIGPHQIYNCGAALAAYRIIMGQEFDPVILSPENPKNPLCTIHWPGRLQRLEPEAYQKIGLTLTHDTQTLFFDGGHNDSAGLMLAKQAKIWEKQDNRPLHLIVAMVNRKNPSNFLNPLIPHAESLTVTAIPNEENSYSTNKIYNLVEPLGFNNLSKTNTVQDALENITDPNARILVTGSLYFIGNLLSNATQD